MKKILLSSAAAFLLISCSNTSSQFINVSLPNFKPLAPTQITTPQSNIAINFSTIEIEQNNNYSDYFQNSILKIRLDKEIELLKQNTEEQIKTILALKGYKIDNTSNAPYSLKGKIIVFIQEDNIEKSSTWLNGESVNSTLSLSFKAKIDFVDNTNAQNYTEFSSNTNLDSSIHLVYPIKSGEGVNIFKTTISTVPTQLNRGLEKPAFEIDKTFLTFYKNTLDTLYNKMPQATSMPTPTQTLDNNTSKNLEFNEFTPLEFNEIQEDKTLQNPLDLQKQIPENNNSTIPQMDKNTSDIFIFE
ncbi:hypothetical protein [Campylobacter sp. US33a]|uniref:hypothetical protein n=1 Tax=Campylobacter sp. US33a TaxID=2498120 RepID=UPI00106880E7|nr:hypothetical protein [Campylobacter sp. US33a]TEY02705.1 hypothetical protein ELQ16_04835 [Campylobacter sp. US33a]